MKICVKCKVDKQDDNFGLDKTKQDGLNSYCKECSLLKSREWRIANQDRKKQYDKNYWVKNKESLKDYKLKYKEKRLKTDPEEYRKERRKNSETYYRKNRDYLNQKEKDDRKSTLWILKEGPCTDCRGLFHPCQMQFDHRDPSTKVANVSDLVGNKKKLLEEVAKCDLLCANCHSFRTWKRKQYDSSSKGGRRHSPTK